MYIQFQEQKEDVGYECRRSIALITTDDECSEDDDDEISVDSGETHETLLTPVCWIVYLKSKCFDVFHLLSYYNRTVDYA